MEIYERKFIFRPALFFLFLTAGLFLASSANAGVFDWAFAISANDQDRVYVGMCFYCKDGYDREDELISDVSPNTSVFIDHRNDPVWYGPSGMYVADIRGDMTANGYKWPLTVVPQGQGKVDLKLIPMLVPHGYELHLYDLDTGGEVELVKASSYADLSATINVSEAERKLMLVVLDPRLAPQTFASKPQASLCFIPAINNGAAIQNAEEVKNITCPQTTPVIQNIVGEDVFVDVLYDGSQVDGSVFAFQLDFAWDKSIEFVECAVPQDDLLREQGASINQFATLLPTVDCRASDAFLGHGGSPPSCFDKMDSGDRIAFALAHMTAEVENGRSWILSRCLVRTEIAPTESKFAWIDEENGDGLGTIVLGGKKDFIGKSDGRLMDAYFGSKPDCQVVYETLSPSFEAAFNPLPFCFDSGADIRVNFSWTLPDGCRTAIGESLSCSPSISLFQDGLPILENSMATSWVETLDSLKGKSPVFHLEAIDSEGVCNSSPVGEPIRIAAPVHCFDSGSGWKAMSFPFWLRANENNESLQSYLTSVFAFRFSEGRFKPADAFQLWPGNGYWIYSPVDFPFELDLKFTDPNKRTSYGDVGYGWNFLGNPYAVDLPWGDNITIDCSTGRGTVPLSEAAAYGWTDGAAYIYNESAITNAEMYRKAEVIPPWSAFYFKSTQPDCDIDFNLP